MLDLINSYSLKDIIVFLIFVALAAKSLVTFWDWMVERLRKVFHRENVAELEKAKIEEHLRDNYENTKQMAEKQEALENQISKLTDKINILVESDKDDIKSFLTREHHYFCYQKKWIDDYSLECCEKRYEHYFNEGGNSFIEGFMKEMRALPKHPPGES